VSECIDGVAARPKRRGVDGEWGQVGGWVY